MDIYDIIEGEYITIALINRLTEKKFVILDEGERKKESWGDKVTFRVMLVQNKNIKYWKPNRESLQLWYDKYATSPSKFDTNLMRSKLGIFEISTINNKPGIIGKPVDISEEQARVYQPRPNHGI